MQGVWRYGDNPGALARLSWGFVFRHIPFWQIQCQLYRLLAVVLRHLFLEFANRGAGFPHAPEKKALTAVQPRTMLL